MAKSGIQLTKASQALLNRLSLLGKVDFRPVFNTISKDYKKEVNAIFNKQQPRQTDMKWEPLSDKYAQWKEKKYPGMPLLVRTGRLKSSMTKQGADNITLIGKISAVFGSSVPYGIYLDEGTSKMPKRNFSEPSERALFRYKRNVESFLVNLFKQNGIEVTTGVLI